MDHTLLLTIGVVSLALFFGFTNGFNDSGMQVASIISSRTLSPEVALSMAAVAEFVGAYFLGTSVARMIGKDIVDPEQLRSAAHGVLMLGCALAGAISWNVVSWYFGIPSSSSHALIGGLLGAFILGVGTQSIHWGIVRAIILVMFISPLIGFVLTYFLTKASFFFAEYLDRRIAPFFKGLQIMMLVGQSLAHGTNDGQKIMGLVVFALILIQARFSSVQPDFLVPQWVVFSCSLVMAFGIICGGWRIIKTLGSKLYHIQPLQSFTALATSAGIILGSSVLGFPISTTQVSSSSVMGAGAGFRPRSVRWAVAQDMVTAWLITIPAAGLLAAGLFKLSRFILF